MALRHLTLRSSAGDLAEHEVRFGETVVALEKGLDFALGESVVPAVERILGIDDRSRRISAAGEYLLRSMPRAALVPQAENRYLDARKRGASLAQEGGSTDGTSGENPSRRRARRAEADFPRATQAGARGAEARRASAGARTRRRGHPQRRAGRRGTRAPARPDVHQSEVLQLQSQGLGEAARAGGAPLPCRRAGGSRQYLPGGDVGSDGSLRLRRADPHPEEGHRTGGGLRRPGFADHRPDLSANRRDHGPSARA